GLVGLAFWRSLADRPRANRLVIGLAGLAAAFEISVILCAGVLFGFGHSPYSRHLIHIAENAWYFSALIFGIEMSRAYLLTVWGRYNSAFAFVTVSVLVAAAWIAPGQYQNLASHGSAINRVSHVYMPGISESLMTSFLASI